MEMVSHVIGRRHRQKYMETKRPDLVTWDSQNVKTQVGKIIRAKAEVIERQDGRGTPKSIVRKGPKGQLNTSTVYPKQGQNRGRGIQERPIPDAPPHLPDFNDHRNRQKSLGHLNNPSLYPDEPNRNWNRQFQGENLSYQDRTGDGLGGADYMKGLQYREDYNKTEYYSPSEDVYVEDPKRRDVLQQRDVSRYDYREQMSHGQGQDHYMAEGPSYKRKYPENYTSEALYSGEAERGQAYSQGYQPSQPAYSEWDKSQRSVERDPTRHNSMNRAHRQESDEPEVKRRNLSAPLESGQSRDYLLDAIRDYHHGMRRPFQEGALDNPGPSRAPATQRRVSVTSTISNIPEPFRRFLKGGGNDDGQGKRKSRFSDASPEEMQMTSGMLNDGYGHPYPQTGGNPRSAGAPFRPDISATQNSGSYREPQGPPITKSYHRGGSESEDVFDVLKNIEIKNADEADFLKSKLCHLLKEFKSKKLETSTLPQQHQYERSNKEDSDLRRTEDLDFSSNRRGSWRQREALPQGPPQEYQHPLHGEPRHSGRPSRGSYEDEPQRYPERFQEPMRSRDHQPGGDGFFDSRSSARPLNMEQGNRMPSGPSFSTNLDKFTSALLEFVARK
ncbi:uncharacterized protein si:ch211-13c6.2 isoform X2 [Cololabis saira]|nr:uncharacterized protein si:ch211-13c6.2 isoform X2 [Cololabis saira]